MPIEEKHKTLLRQLGLTEADFDLIDGKYVRYEYDEGKGVRLYDPYYTTSYNEYIDSDGWSSWSSEQDNFMSNILKPAQEEARRREGVGPKPTAKELSEALRRKFQKDGSRGPE